jgi:U3 small nucleolar ribonucleoprotein protein IMP4
MDAEDEATKHQKLAVDDEYALAGVMEPKVCVTTSHDPSSRLKQFAKEVRYIIPNAQTLNRGSTTVKELVDTCRDAGMTDLIIVQETRGEPDALIVSHLPYGPTAFFTLSSVVMRHDIADRGTVSGAYPHLILDGFSSPIGKRFATILQHLFPIPKEDSKRVITFANRSDTISFRHHTYTKSRTPSAAAAAAAAASAASASAEAASAAAGGGGGGGEDIVLTEVGPRMEMTPFQIKLGTLDQTEAETEWVLRPYMRTAAKRKAL